MKRPTEKQAARIEARIENLRAAGKTDEAYSLMREYWDACGLCPDIREQLEASIRITPVIKFNGNKADWEAELAALPYGNPVQTIHDDEARMCRAGW